MSIQRDRPCLRRERPQVGHGRREECPGERRADERRSRGRLPQVPRLAQHHEHRDGAKSARLVERRRPRLERAPEGVCAAPALARHGRESAASASVVSRVSAHRKLEASLL